MHKVFLDTDVILDLFIDREPHHKEALRLFSFIKRNNIQGCTSPVIIANTYYMLAKIKNKKYAIDKIQRLRGLLGIAPLDEVIIDYAIRTPYKDFEDSIQYYCALRSDIQFLITRNITDYPKAELNVVNPTEYMKISMR